jgi:hypothetical protein
MIRKNGWKEFEYKIRFWNDVWFIDNIYNNVIWI